MRLRSAAARAIALLLLASPAGADDCPDLTPAALQKQSHGTPALTLRLASAVVPDAGSISLARVPKPHQDTRDVVFHSFLASGAKLTKVTVLPADQEDSEETRVRLQLPRFASGWPGQDGWLWQDMVLHVVGCASGEVAIAAQAPVRVSKRRAALASTLVSVTLLYLVVSWVLLASRGQWVLSPVKATAGRTGHASLSKLQVLFFTFLVVGLLVFLLLRTGALGNLSQDVLLLIGISAGGAAGSAATVAVRQRLTLENWCWLDKKGWLAALPPGRARWRDLLMEGEELQVSKFQMLAFNLVVAGALLSSGLGGMAEFAIPSGLLGVLGLSQVVYLSGKAVGPSNFNELNRKLDDLRKLEQKFATEVDQAWRQAAPAARTLAEAQAAAPQTYQAYRKSALEAAEMARTTLHLPSDATLDPSPALP